MSTYCTIQEAYNVPTINYKESKKIKESFKNKKICSNNDKYYDDTYNLNLCDNNENFSNYKTPNQCESLQTPDYSFPISEETKEQFKETIDVALNQKNEPLSNKMIDNMDNIKSYVEDDLDMYFEYDENINKTEIPSENNQMIVRPKINKKKNIKKDINISEKFVN